MKRIRCPKCDEPIVVDDSRYEAGRTLVFECKACGAQFRVRVGLSSSAPATAAEQEREVGRLVVIENAFHLKQEIALHLGDNVVGRHVPGTKANAAIKTLDPSVDTTHCVVTAQQEARTGRVIVSVRDAGSSTGTFVDTSLLGPREHRRIDDGAIITIGATTMILKIGHRDQEELRS